MRGLGETKKKTINGAFNEVPTRRLKARKGSNKGLQQDLAEISENLTQAEVEQLCVARNRSGLGTVDTTPLWPGSRDNFNASDTQHSHSA